MKDLQFNIGKLTSIVKSQVARNNPLQDQEARALNLWLFEERNHLALSRTRAYQQGETNRAFLEWVQEDLDKSQENLNYCEDIQEIGSTLYSLLCKQTELENQYAERYILYRRAIKSLRDREKELASAREKKQSLQDRIDRLKKSNPKSRKLQELVHELEHLELDDQGNETAEFKRFILKESFYLRFNALQEYAEKMAIIAGYGKFITDLLDADMHASSNCDMILKDALLTIDNWESKDQRETFAVEDMTFDNEPDNECDFDAVLLTDTELVRRHDIECQVQKMTSELVSEATDTPGDMNQNRQVDIHLQSSTTTDNEHTTELTHSKVTNELVSSQKAEAMEPNVLVGSAIKTNSTDYYNLFVSQQKLPIRHTHRSYEEFQNQLGNDEKRQFYDDLPPPAYSKGDNDVPFSDEKKAVGY